MRDGRLPVADLITHRYPLEAHREAVRTATDKRTGAIKVVFQTKR
jgi:threonine dehydrogenase-like Zn-dependent dehydrogenase